MKAYKTVIQFNEFLFQWLKSLPFKSGQNVEVIILPAEEKKNSKQKLKDDVLKYHESFDSCDDKNQWDTIAQQNFARAYGEDEPEYTINLIKEPNADEKNSSKT